MSKEKNTKSTYIPYFVANKENIEKKTRFFIHQNRTLQLKMDALVVHRLKVFLRDFYNAKQVRIRHKNDICILYSLKVHLKKS